MTELTRTLEDYIETIHILQQEGGSASVTDIAMMKRVKSPSVTYILQKLRTLDLVNYRKYRSVSLTPKGLEIAQKLETKHRTLKWFFELIGVDDQIANADACEFEHFVNPQTVEKLTQFAEWVKGEPKRPLWLDRFREFQRTGQRV